MVVWLMTRGVDLESCPVLPVMWGSEPFQEMVIGLRHVRVGLRDVQASVTNGKGVF